MTLMLPRVSTLVVTCLKKLALCQLANLANGLMECFEATYCQHTGLEKSLYVDVDQL